MYKRAQYILAANMGTSPYCCPRIAAWEGWVRLGRGPPMSLQLSPIALLEFWFISHHGNKDVDLETLIFLPFFLHYAL